ncbi:hypothetical protein [Brucella pituitosa]|uniref:hypothetical protein n=1 Tax=Brucella pituitosa TaxID=571256 RepID=UPI003F4AAE7E
MQLDMLDGKTCAVHWNHVEGFVQQFINVAVDPGIYRANENIWTCAGGSATIGMMLHRVNQYFGGQIVSDVCDLAININARCGNEP